MPCRYYGMSHAVYNQTGELISSGGNECGIYKQAFSPCALEVAGKPVDEEQCSRFHNHQIMLLVYRGYCDCHPEEHRESGEMHLRRLCETGGESIFVREGANTVMFSELPEDRKEHYIKLWFERRFS